MAREASPLWVGLSCKHSLGSLEGPAAVRFELLHRKYCADFKESLFQYETIGVAEANFAQFLLLDKQALFAEQTLTVELVPAANGK